MAQSRSHRPDLLKQFDNYDRNENEFIEYTRSGFNNQEGINHEVSCRLKQLEELLFVIDRNKEYEELYPELKAAYEEYNRILEKYKLFNELKKDRSE